MGVLTDFVVAGYDDAERIGESDVPSREFNGIDAKGMDQVRMATLHSILSGTEYDPGFLVDDEYFQYTGSSDGPWVQRLPEEFTRSLAELTPERLSAVATEWSQTEEFEPEYSVWSFEDITAFLGALHAMAKNAVVSNQAIFMWTSL